MTRSKNLSEKKEKIVKFYTAHKRMPSFRELCALAGYASTNAATRLVRKLEDEGFLKRDKSGRLIPRRLFGAVRVLGLVEAGFPTPAQEELIDTMTFDEYLIQHPDATYVLKVKGDSMHDAGIRENDMVVVERTQKYKAGDIVVAAVDNEWTMKYLRGKPGEWWLEPANKAFKPIRPKGELRIEAVVKAIVRRYA